MTQSTYEIWKDKINKEIADEIYLKDNPDYSIYIKYTCNNINLSNYSSLKSSDYSSSSSYMKSMSYAKYYPLKPITKSIIKIIHEDGKIQESDFPILFNGCGKIIYDDGSVYEGKFINGSLNGFGKIIFKDNSILEGNFNNGMLIYPGLS